MNTINDYKDIISTHIRSAVDTLMKLKAEKNISYNRLKEASSTDGLVGLTQRHSLFLSTFSKLCTFFDVSPHDLLIQSPNVITPPKHIQRLGDAFLTLSSKKQESLLR